MPKTKTLEELLKDAKTNVKNLAKTGIEETPWEEASMYQGNIKITDFATKRVLGMGGNNIQAEHEINQAPFRLASVPDGPRKKAAEVVWEKYQETFEQFLTENFEQNVLDEAVRLVDRENYPISEDDKTRIKKSNGSHRGLFEAMGERLRTYQNFANSFFGINVVEALRADSHIDPKEARAEAQVLQELTEALPQTPEFDIFRTRDGYAAQQPLPMAPTEVVMNMNPTLITTITVEEFPASIRGPHPSPLNLEWGAATFDNMMERIYNWDEWNQLKDEKKDLLNTVYLDGRPASELFPAKEGEEKADYDRRVKSEVVAYALEGKGKIDVTPYRRGEESYTFKEPIPVHVNVNLPEKVSIWKRFLRFFNVKKFELQKEKAQRISREDLNHDGRVEEVRENMQRLIGRENESAVAKTKIEETMDHVRQANLDFFGYLAERKNDEHINRYEGRINSAVRNRVTATVTPEIQRELGLDSSSVMVSKTMDRPSSRANLVQLYALTQGMTAEQVLSQDPAYREQKSQIGRRFMELITVKGAEEFYKEQGADADYRTYFQEKCQNAYDMYRSIHQMVANYPCDVFRVDSPRELAENYEKIHMMVAGVGDLIQVCPDQVAKLNPDEMEQLKEGSRGVGSLREVTYYLENYVAADAYVQAVPSIDNDRIALVAGMKGREIVGQIAAAAQGAASLGELSNIFDETWNTKKLTLEVALSEIRDPQGLREAADFMEKNGRPVIYYDDNTQMYQSGRADAVERALQERERQRQQQAAPGRQSMSLEDLAGPAKRSREPLHERARQSLSKEPAQKKTEKAGIQK